MRCVSVFECVCVFVCLCTNDLEGEAVAIFRENAVALDGRDDLVYGILTRVSRRHIDVLFLCYL